MGQKRLGMPTKYCIRSPECDKKSLLDVLLGCWEGRGERTLVNKAGRNERSLGSQAEVRLCMHLMPSGGGYTTKVKDKGIKKNALFHYRNENTVYVYKL